MISCFQNRKTLNTIIVNEKKTYIEKGPIHNTQYNEKIISQNYCQM